MPPAMNALGIIVRGRMFKADCKSIPQGCRHFEAPLLPSVRVFLRDPLLQRQPDGFWSSGLLGEGG